MLSILLALALGSSALAQDDGTTPTDETPVRDDDPGAVIAVGPRMSLSAALVDDGWLGADATAQVSVEARIDKRTAFRVEGGYNPVRGRVHVGGAGRAYPAGRGKSAWWAEVSFNIQRTGARIDPDLWAPRPARGWVSLPFLYGAGWRLLAGERLVLDLGGHVGTTVEIRPQASFPVGFGFVATGHLFLGTAF